jgi:hypothetical protein
MRIADFLAYQACLSARVCPSFSLILPVFSQKAEALFADVILGE